MSINCIADRDVEKCRIDLDQIERADRPSMCFRPKHELNHLMYVLHPSRVPSFYPSQFSKMPPQPVAPPRTRILALHGFRTSAAVLQSQAGGEGVGGHGCDVGGHALRSIAMDHHEEIEGILST